MTRHNWITYIVLILSIGLLMTVVLGCAPKYEPPGRDLWRMVPPR